MINTYAIYIEKLNPDFRAVFKTISDYVYAGSADAIRTEEILSDVMDMFLSAQSEGKSPEQITGGNLPGFCKHLCADIGIRSKFINLMERLHPMFLLYTVLCVFDLMDMLSGQGDFWTFPAKINLGVFLIGNAIVITADYIGQYIIRKYIFSNPDKYKIISRAIRFGLIAVLAAAVIYVSRNERAEGLPLWIALTCCAVFLIAYRILTRKSRQYRRENRISLQELTGVSMDMKDEIENMEMKRFEKLRKKHLRKNRPEPTFAEFLTLEEKECTKWDKQPAFYILMALGSTVLGLVFTYFFGGFEHGYDALFFVGILLAVESAIMYGLFRLVDSGTKARLNWIHTKRES